ncbi:uncharacterized protein LOC123316829 isoform X1 [Coccinella septempunctata]|uniref:uncharacterized protein LOC123316829 isoform X1 n=1 Tax=Coccinella septempunctata TaxID=41139 RepID=UPI001D086CEB|nr:uncharacterized protein LOC123316829 isoform X1 [Coccinella septempunctata]
MKYVQVITFFISFAVISVYSAQWKALPNANFLQGRTGECYDSLMQIGYMKTGESKTNQGSCVKVNCLVDGSISYYGCPALMNCGSYTADSSKPYPYCCPICLRE